MSTSLWQKFHVERSNNITSSFNCETCVVGAGIAGLTAAYRLIKNGKQVVVVHAGDLRAGETSKSTAQINTAHDDGWADMLDLHGKENLRLCYESYHFASDFIKETVQSKKLHCGYEEIQSYLFAKESKEGEEWIDSEFEAAKLIGVTEISRAGESPLKEYLKGPALIYSSQAQFQPLAYLSELRRLILESGKGQIFGNAGVKEVVDGDQVRLILDSEAVIAASNVILATNAPIFGRLVPIEALAPYRSYVVAFRVKKNAIPLYQYWDNEDPYHYVRLESAAAELDHPTAEYDILLVGGEDHRVGEVKDSDLIYRSLSEWTHKHFPVEDLTGLKWSSQTIETFDGMPLIGLSAVESKGKIFIITGDSGTGITHGTLGGLMVADKLSGVSYPWEKIYDPGRSRIKSLKRWVNQNLANAAAYQDWLKPGEVENEDEIPHGSGAIVRDGLKKIAVYKDADGIPTRLSAVCPHLGAIVRWNPVEKSWDCPAHGSRYSPKGSVLNGPAHSSLNCLDKETAEVGINQIEVRY